MEINTLNEILNFIEAEHRISEKLDLPPSGQREVFLAENISTGETCIAKICDTIPVNVARIQREIRILSGLDSKYFPKFYFQSFISRDIISNLFDSFDPRVEHEKKRIEELKSEKIYPFLITIEEFIEHVHWKDAIETIREEKNLVELLIHLFQALSLLWQKKIVHRDLKPDNILLRENLLPVIIDLGIAKSFRDGTQNLTHYLFGTPCTHQYAALEQLINSKTEITYKTDQFAIGVIAFQILTDKFPYGVVKEEGVEQIVDNLLHERSESILNNNKFANVNLVKFIEKLLQAKPYKRFRNVEIILMKLQEIRGELA